MRAVSPQMKELLWEIKKRSETGEPPIGLINTQSARGLVSRGLLKPVSFLKNGKTFYGFNLSEPGMAFMHRLENPVKTKKKRKQKSLPAAV